MEEKAQNFAIFTRNLCKTFNGQKAVREVNLRIEKGEIYALIGPNGAGKTTLIKLLVGLLRPSKGEAFIFGHNIVFQPVKAKETFGYISDNPAAYDYLTGYEFLALTGNLRGMKADRIKKRIEELSTLFPLREILHQRMANYSRGNRQKVAFLASLLSKPKLLIVDEPIAGLDPESIKIFGKKLKEFAQKGGTVFFATHILRFGEIYAHRVGLMDEGKIVKEEDITAGESLYRFYMTTKGKA